MMGEMEFLNQLVGEAEGMEDRFNVSFLRAVRDVHVFRIGLTSIQLQHLVINVLVIEMLAKLLIEVAPKSSMNTIIQNTFITMDHSQQSI
jgi:hypothetical protein